MDPMTDEEYENINERSSKKGGLFGWLENLLRKIPTIGMLIVSAFILVTYVLCLGTALTPGAMLFIKIEEMTGNSPLFWRAFFLSLSMGMGLFLFAFTLIFIVPLVNLPFLPFVKPYRGPWFSLESIPWYIHNALTYLVRYTILELLTPSPLNLLFYKMMGMKVGKGVMINSSNISDPCMITLGDYVVIGGSAYLMAHYGMKGYLIIDKLEIGTGTTIGLNANIMGGVKIGKKATVAPNCVALPKTIIPDNGKFGLSDQDS